MLFWICAAGKNGMTAAKCLDKLLQELEYKVAGNTHFERIRNTQVSHLAILMRDNGIGCHSIKANTFIQLANSGLNLKNCSTDDLEKIKGIGPKTSRCFIIHSRRNQQLAGLDRHILSYLSDLGYTVPKSTPTGNKYKQIEKWFLAEVKKSGKTVSELDLEIWNKYRNK